MSTGSWVILGVLVLVVALAIRTVFFKKNTGGACHSAGSSVACQGCALKTQQDACQICLEKGETPKNS